MCMVSAVINNWMTQYPQPWQVPVLDYPKYFNELFDAKELDLKTGQIDCSSADKQQWHEELVKKIESSAK